jgi:flagellar hook-associated protein 2
MDDGTGGLTDFHLVITSDDTGTDNAITMDDVDNTNDTDLTMTNQQAATNAQITVNNLVYERQTNTIDDILSGVTLSLQGTGDTVVTVSQDIATVRDKIVGLVNAYNTVLEEIDTNSDYDAETGVAGSLNGLSAVRDLEGTLNNIFFANITGLSTEYSNLAELGFTFERTGYITVDEDDFADALVSNLDDVKGLFLGDVDADIDGIADRLYDALVDITLATSDGIISSETARVQTAIDNLDDEVEQTNERIDARYATMEKQFIRLDQLLANFEKTGNYLAGQFQSLNDMWVKNN